MRSCPRAVSAQRLPVNPREQEQPCGGEIGVAMLALAVVVTHAALELLSSRLHAKVAAAAAVAPLTVDHGRIRRPRG